MSGYCHHTDPAICQSGIADLLALLSDTSLLLLVAEAMGAITMVGSVWGEGSGWGSGVPIDPLARFDC